MTRHRYEYAVLSYSPDPGARESLNIGVALFCPDTRFLRLLADAKYARLSRAFADFEATSYRRALYNLKLAFRQAEKIVGRRSFGTPNPAPWITGIMPDGAGALRFTAPRSGQTTDPATELGILFDRMVESMKGEADEVPRRSDELVWKSVQTALPPRVLSSIREQTFETRQVKVKFAHAIKNGAWHVVQPVSMDYKQPESMQRRAAQILGTSMGLRDAKELGTIIYLLGKPTGARRPSYLRAKELIDQSPINHQIIEETETERLGEVLLAKLGEH